MSSGGSWIIDGYRNTYGYGTITACSPDQIVRFDLKPGGTFDNSTRVVSGAGTVTNGWTTDAGTGNRVIVAAAFAPVP